MSEESPQPQATLPAPPARRRLHWLHVPARFRPAAFVVVFMSIVFVLLMGYRFAVDSPYNDWYLFQVSSNTASVLGLIGDHAELEHGREQLGDPRTLRARLNAWGRGVDKETPEDFLSAQEGPLSEWEAWSYRAQEMRRAATPGERGPRVQFIMRRGLSFKVRDLEDQLRQMESDGTASLEERQKLRAQVEESRKKLNDHRTNPDVDDNDPTYMFYFIVVSECGAIEVMAIFLAAVVAFPTQWWKKLLGLLVGLPVMYGVNVLRLTCLAIIGAYDTNHEYFNFVHEYVWQAVYIIFVVAVWMIWVEYVVRGRLRGDAPDDAAEQKDESHA